MQDNSSTSLVFSFDSKEFGKIRTYSNPDGSVLFCAKDVCDCLGYANNRKAIADHCKGVTNRYPLVTGGGTQDFVFITEPDVMRLIVSSKLPAAQKFEAWVFEEVLPSIRKRGVYATAEAAERLMQDPDFLIKTFEELKKERARAKAATELNQRYEIDLERSEKRIERMKPKALFADAVATSDSAILIGDLAKIIKQSCSVDTGQKRLFAWMRDNGWLMKEGSSKNMPTQRGMDMGLFRVKETTITNPDGSVRVTKTTKVTGRGQQYFVNLFAKMAGKVA